MTTLTVYPDAGSGSTTCDGYMAASEHQIWANMLADSGNSSDDNDSSGVFCTTKTDQDDFWTLYRSGFTFDTSSISGGATIDSATLSLYGTAKLNELGSTPLHVASFNPSLNNDIVNADFAQLGSTTFGNIAYAAYSTSAYNDITLNASGEAAINKGGITRLGVRLGWDLDGGSFGGSWDAEKETGYSGYYADQTGTTNDPKLVVVYGEGGIAPHIHHLKMAGGL